MSMFRGKEPQLVIGAAPRIDLMPPEVRQRQKDKSARFGLIMMVVIVAGGVVVGYLIALLAVGISQSQLASEQQRTETLLTAQQQYAEVPQITSVLEAGADGEAVATSSQIDWGIVVRQIQATMPANLGLIDISAAATSPTVAVPVPVGSSEVPYVAALTISAESATVPDTAEWLRRLRTVTGYAGAWLTTISESSGRYSVSVTLHLDDAAIMPPSGADEGEGTDK